MPKMEEGCWYRTASDTVLGPFKKVSNQWRAPGVHQPYNDFGYVFADYESPHLDLVKKIDPPDERCPTCGRLK